VDELGGRCRVDADRDVVLEREPTMPREVVSVSVRLDGADDADVAPLGLLEVLLDRECRVDHGCLPGARIADEIGSTPERVIDELREDHPAADRTSGSRYFS
jgi:hypothetical protein